MDDNELQRRGALARLVYRSPIQLWLMASVWHLIFACFATRDDFLRRMARYWKFPTQHAGSAHHAKTKQRR